MTLEDNIKMNLTRKLAMEVEVNGTAYHIWNAERLDFTDTQDVTFKMLWGTKHTVKPSAKIWSIPTYLSAHQISLHSQMQL